MTRFDEIRPFYDSEINQAILQNINNPMMKSMIQFFLPEKTEEEWKEALKKVTSIREFQTNFVYHGVQQVIKNSSSGLTTSGFEHLEKDTPYLLISNHRDIVLDTTLINACLYEKDLVMSASAIGDNLVKRSIIKVISRMNRNFLVKRGLNPREMLESSRTLSELIGDFILNQKTSVWIAQREGRTKDGNDATHSGVIKMIGMASDEARLIDYFKKLKIAPIAISYEYDPTDALKMPQIMAEINNEKYVKNKNEDFLTLLSGIVGQKKKIHIHVGKVLDSELDEIAVKYDSSNKQIQAIAQAIDNSILANYVLHATNYIAYDLVNKSNRYSHFYTENEKMLFERRLEKKIDKNNPIARDSFLAMYANPVVNKLKYVQID